jgi:hypothetical protein
LDESVLLDGEVKADVADDCEGEPEVESGAADGAPRADVSSAGRGGVNDSASHPDRTGSKAQPMVS